MHFTLILNYFSLLILTSNIFTSPLFIFKSLLCCGQAVLTTETEVLLAVMLSEPFLFKNLLLLNLPQLILTLPRLLGLVLLHSVPREQNMMFYLCT